MIVSNLSTGLLATALDLSKHDYCDIRREVTEYIPVLANLLGERSVLRDCCTEMLKDQVRLFFLGECLANQLKDFGVSDSVLLRSRRSPRKLETP